MGRKTNGYVGCGVCEGQLFISQYCMAGGVCGQVVDRKLDGYSGCGYARDKLYSLIWHGRNGCGKVVD